MGTNKIIRAIVVCLLLIVARISIAAAQAGVWWNRDWHYCLDFSVPTEEIRGKAATVYVDFAGLMREAGIEGELDRNSVRVLQVDDFGDDRNTIAPCLFEERIGPEAGWGYITWLRGEQSRPQIYFDTVKNGHKKPPTYDIPDQLLKYSINLVPNPGFEHDKDGNGFPDGWSFVGHDINTGWSNDPKFVSLVYSLSDTRAHSGMRSLKWALGRAVGKWKDTSSGCRISDEILPAVCGRTMYFRGYAYLGSGSGIVPIRIRRSGKRGWLGEITAKTDDEARGRWLEVKGAGVIPQGVTRMDIHISMRPADKDAVFYFDDFNLQSEYPQVADVSLDKKEYFLSDSTAFVTVKLNVNTEVLMPMRATIKGEGTGSKLVTPYLKTKLSRHYLGGKILRLVVAREGRTLVMQELAVQHEVKTPLAIGKLEQGKYVLRASIVDDIGHEVFGTSRDFTRIKGPFDF